MFKLFRKKVIMWKETYDKRLTDAGYSLWSRDDNGTPVYQVTVNGQPPTGAGGYYNLQSLYTLKGV